MSATTSKDDKFAFLFKTNAITDFNLDDVKSTLKTCYGYQDTNIVEATGCDNIASSFSTLASTVMGHTPMGDVPSGTKKNTLIIFIVGNADSNGLITSAGSNILLWDDLVAALFPLPVNPYTNSEAHFYFIFPYCDTFYSSMFPFPDGSVSFPITADFTAFSGHSSFIADWVSSFGANAIDSYDADYLLRFDFAADTIYSLHGAPSLPLSTYYRQRKNNGNESAAPFSPFYPGYPAFGINDSPSPAWWESPDIYLNNTIDNDIYNPEADNDVYIQVHNTGTHPVGTFWIGAKHFGSGLGTGDAIKVDDPTYPDSTLPALLNPGEYCTYVYTQMFATGTVHRCVVARAQKNQIYEADINDYAYWSIEERPHEAQRNLDPLTTSSSPIQPPEPDQAQNPDPDPDPDEADDNNTGDRSLNNLRGFKEHIYTILNTFREKRKFRIVLHKEFEKYSKLFKVKFLLLSGENGQKTIPLEIVKKPYPHIPITLGSRQKADILFYLALKPKAIVQKEIRLPLEILVEIVGKKPLKTRMPKLFRDEKAFASAGGITVRLSTKAYTIQGQVIDAKGKPVPGANVNIRTINGRQAAVLKTDKKGVYLMKSINPDSYRIYASFKNAYSKDQVVNLFSRDMFIDLRLVQD